MFLMELLPEHGLVIELDQSGRILRSLHDPTGDVAPSVSEVLDYNGTLYLGSYQAPGLMKLTLK